MSEPLRTLLQPPLVTLPLSRSHADRGADFRLTPNLFAGLWASADTQVLVLAQGRTPLAGGALRLFGTDEVPRPENPVYLGRVLPGARAAGAHVVLVMLDDLDEALAPGAEWHGLREVAAFLDARDVGLFVEAAALAHWHATHTHCPRCGSPTVPEYGGWVRRCPVDESLHYPRTDPAIIVSVIDAEDRILLGSAVAWPANRFSTLAGFVEPGESLEAAVLREVAEESGVEVHSPQYLGSQPWPFPASLMLGYTAVAAGTDLRPDGVEIETLRWFTRRELHDELRDGRITVAGEISIARALIERWYGGPLEAEPDGALLQ
ncbi:NAD(+) diphosphatase [Arthrobacter zhaoguopingii]|uniref:NAD(+) diphosphatase n=1 Tax=Arthrobacter zhaoguopingii TaxID=2681491 RepID=UPI0013582637|nr:NAD(+) diphosphatase [Arthrobacter zhaoguopingii]